MEILRSETIREVTQMLCHFLRHSRFVPLLKFAMVLFFFLDFVVNDAKAATYHFETVDVPGASSTLPNSINDRGQVAGGYEMGSFVDSSYVPHGFVYSNGAYTTIDVPATIDVPSGNSNASYTLFLNNSGQVAGTYWFSCLLGCHVPPHSGFLYDNGTFTTIRLPNSINNRANSINDNGQVAGTSWDGSYHGFVYSNGAYTTIDVPGATYYTEAASINASGQVAGNYGTGSHLDGSYVSHGFVYSNGTYTTIDVPGAVSTYLTGINNSGQVAGNYGTGSHLDGSYVSHGFVYSNGTYTTIDVPGAVSTYLTGINNSGQVIGSYWDGSYTHNFVYSNGTYTTIDVPGAIGTVATSINTNGQVTGYYRDDSSGQHGFIATPVCITPTVTVQTLTTVPQGRFIITGSITLDGVPLCALVLANSQFMFTCGDSLPKGDFALTVSPGADGQITLFGFSSGLSPFQQTLGPGFSQASTNANSCATPTVTHTLTTAPHGFRLTGSITLNGAPLCALVLANSQFMFTCGDPLPSGNFDLTVSPDADGQITLFGFSAGLMPFQQTFSPSTP